MRRSRRPAASPRAGLEGAPSLMAGALASVGLGDVACYLQIERVFAEAVGPVVAANARPVSFSRGKLVLSAESSTWRNELHFLREQIATSINAALPRAVVQQVRLVARPQAPQAAGAPAAVHPVPTQPSAHADGAAREAARAIGDPELRELFSRTMARGLDRARRQAQEATAKDPSS